MNMVVPEWLSWQAQRVPNRQALATSDATFTFQQLCAAADRLARQLIAFGVASGDRVATLLPNSYTMVLAVHAVSRIPAVLVPLNTRLSPAELAPQLAEASPRVLLTNQTLLAHAQAALEQATTHGLEQSCRIVLADTADADALSVPLLETAPEAPATVQRTVDLNAVHTIVYTSGTTGRPKGVMLTYGNHWWNAIGSALNLGVTPEDCWLLCMPLFHVGGISILFRSVIGGFRVLVHERFDTEAVNAAIDRGDVTMISVVSTMLWRMLRARGERPFPPSLRVILLGGGPAPRPLLEACARLGAPVVQTYGLTETASQVVTLAPEDALRKLGAAGKPLYPNALRILGKRGEATPGEVGEILVRGPVVTPGYFQQPERTAAAFQDGWLRTGDLGYLDEDGYLYVLDRREDLIVTGGENVYPAEVEAVLLAHPAVADACVVGVPDPEWGQRVVAAVQLHPDAQLDAAALQAWCRDRLAGYKVPRDIRFVAALPRTASGKLRRHAVRDGWTQPASEAAPPATARGRPGE